MKKIVVVFLSLMVLIYKQKLFVFRTMALVIISFLLLSNELFSMAHDQNFLIPSNAANNDYVGKLVIDPNLDTLGIISYSVVTDNSGIFGISGNYLIVEDNTNLQSGITYSVTFRISNGTSSEDATASIYVAPVASCEFLDLDGGDSFADYDNAFTSGKYYLAKRGTSETISQQIEINTNVTIGAYGAGAYPVINSNAADKSLAVFRTQADGITIRDIKLTNTTIDQSLLIAYSDNVIVDNCEVTGDIDNSNGQGIRTYIANNVAILNTTIHDLGNDAIFIQGTTGTEIGYCTAYNTGRYMFNGGNSSTPVGDCVQTANSQPHDNIWIHHGYFNKIDNVGKACFMFQSTNQDGDFTIEYNKIISNSSNDNVLFNLNMDTLIFKGNYVSDSRYKLLAVYHSTLGGTVNYGLIENNIFIGGTNQALELRGNKYDIVNNVFWKQGSRAIYIIEANDDYDFYNNIFVQDSDGTYAIQGYSNAYGNDTIKNNLYHPSALLGTNYSQGANAVIDNPEFVDTTFTEPYKATNFMLRSTSPAIDAAFDYGRDADMLGQPVYNTNWDIGAFEYGSATGNAVVSITATDASASEQGQATGTFTISRTTTSGNLSVNYTKTGTTSSGDYTQTLTGSVTISDGNSTATITITPVDDATFEGNETVILTLATGSGYTVGTPSSATVTIADNDDDKIAFWAFEEGSGTTAQDSTVNNHDGTLTNGASFNADEKYGSYSMYLDGANDYMNAGTINLGSQFTVSMWAKIPSSGSSNIQTLFANASSVSTYNGIKIYVNSYGTTDRKIWIETSNGSVENAASTNSNVFAFNQWNHLVVVIDKTNGKARIYYNGSNVTQDSLIRTDFGTNQTVHLGQMTNNNWTMIGYLDQVKIYNRMLTSSEAGNVLKSALLPRKESSGFSVSVYPNPFTDLIRLNNTKDIVRVEMINMGGQSVFMEENTDRQSMIIDGRNLKRGTYIIKLLNKTGTVSVFKVIK